MLKKLSDAQLAAQFRNHRMEMRQIQNELNRRGFTVSEIHGRTRVPVTGFENIIIDKPSITKI